MSCDLNGLILPIVTPFTAVLDDPGMVAVQRMVQSL
jgi:hypothetical protein